LRLKLGAVKTFASPGVSVGYAFKNSSRVSPYPVFGLELAKRLRNRNHHVFVGVSFDIQGFSESLIYKNFQTVISDGGGLGLVLATWRLYAGFELRIGRKTEPKNKNYFAVFGGMGLTLNPFGGSGEGPISTGKSEGITKNGEHFLSPYTPGSFMGDYQTQVYVKREFPITPTVFAGIRWHITNKKGNDALILELLANYGLGRYYNYHMPYTIDGVNHEDVLGEKGVCIQFNILIPLVNFKKHKGP
jgi:hypothetical protein